MYPKGDSGVLEDTALVHTMGLIWEEHSTGSDLDTIILRRLGKAQTVTTIAAIHFFKGIHKYRSSTTAVKVVPDADGIFTRCQSSLWAHSWCVCPQAGQNSHGTPAREVCYPCISQGRPADCEFMKSQVKLYIDRGTVRPSKSTYAASSIVISQPHHLTMLKHMVHDYRKLNTKTMAEPSSIAVMEDVLDDIMQQGTILSNQSTTQSWYQMSISYHMGEGRLIHKAWLVTPDGKYEYLCMASGFCIVPQIMQMVMRCSFDGLPHKAACMDDVAQGALHDTGSPATTWRRTPMH